LPAIWLGALAWTDAIASKLAPTKAGGRHEPVGASLLAMQTLRFAGLNASVRTG